LDGLRLFSNRSILVVAPQNVQEQLHMTQYLDAITLKPVSAPPASAWGVEENSAPRCLVGPAFFDPQVNGYAGVEFADPDLTIEQLASAVLAIRRDGCSHFFLTLVTNEAGALESQLARVAGLIEASDLVREAIVGFHLEGPFISPEPGYRGAHREQYVLPPDWPLFQRLQKASGNRIRMVTLAPEWPNSAEFIRKAAGSGVFVCLGHTNASRDELLTAADAGARMVTHLGNGCPLKIHRHDNIIQRVLSVKGLMASLIPDGIHLPPFVLSNLARSLGPNRLVFTTDAVTPAGAPPGRYLVGHQQVTVGENRVVMHADGKHFAGSALTMDQGFQNSITLAELDVSSAWRAWTWLRDIILPEITPPSLVIPHVDVRV
jgi:N-acetylglucosamine-6-phosphate deacetylase